MQQVRVLMVGYETKRSNDWVNLTKKRLTIRVGISTGHCRLNYHLGKLGMSMDTVCRFCEESDEAFTHVLGQSQVLVQSRHLGGYSIPDARMKHFELGISIVYVGY